ncbi:Smr/MutS family protein [Thiomicrorhabdus indica]|uniref:Smr/MutS family protein n=1 Tax=Thiomicrorhabdus indica TaxID=2267253 RepID=UPI00102DB995|nr:Smr/MutS family protein [Thiomicrorhabdus indica]
MNSIKKSLKKIHLKTKASTNASSDNHKSASDKIDDSALFLEAMQDVTPINNHNRISLFENRSEKQAQKHLKKIRNKQPLAPKNLEFKELDSSHPIKAFDTVTYYEKGLRLQDLSRLKRSEFYLEASLDLHGKTSEEAEIAIENFISQAISCGMKYVRIIHGKGYNSDNDFPVLKNLCYQKLKTLKNIVGFCSAPEKDGGVGAVNIQLKTK